MEYLIDQGMNYFKGIDWTTIFEKGITVVLVFIAIIVSIRIAFKTIDGIFNERKEEFSPREARRIVTLNTTVKAGTKAAIWGLGGLTIVGQFINVTSVLAVAGVGTLAISLGARGLVEDIMGGFVIILENQFSVGDYIILDDDHHGIVEAIGLRTTNLREFDGGLFIIHNGKIDRLINYSKGNMKIMLEVGVAYEEDIDNVFDTLDHLCDELFHEHRDLFFEKPIIQGITDLGASAINIRIICDSDANSKFEAERLLRKHIKKEFDQKGIEIPYNKTVIVTNSNDK